MEPETKKGCNHNGYNPIKGSAIFFYKKRRFLPEPASIIKGILSDSPSGKGASSQNLPL
jgi:hypothetical protein